MLGMIGRRLQITRCDVCFKHAGKVKRFSGCVTKSVSGGTHGSFFKRSLLLDTVVAKATQRQTTTLLSPLMSKPKGCASIATTQDLNGL